MNQGKYLITALIALGMFISIPANAHHPWDGQIEQFNFLQGVLSGLAHPTPVLGFDHFLFLISIGLIGKDNRLKWIPGLVAIGLLGSMLSQVLPLFPGVEVLIGLSIIASALLSLKKIRIIFFTPFIFLHGLVLGNAMIGIEPTPLAGYLGGLLISEILIILLGSFVFERFWMQRRMFCTAFLGAGLVITTNIIL